MLSFLGAASHPPHPQHSNIGDISDSNEHISTRFSAIYLLTRVISRLLSEKMLKYVTPSWGDPPFILKHLIDISGI